MPSFSTEVTVTWGESDPFGLVYYPRILAWFNDAEHELFRRIGYPIDAMIRGERTTFVMGDVRFRFVGPAAYGDRVTNSLTLVHIGERTLTWECEARQSSSGAAVTRGRAVRVYAHIGDDGSLRSVPIPDTMRRALEPFRAANGQAAAGEASGD